ncbi:ankyrin repeat-containing domain protein [Camillea tinctor]|nr:ankyrin repeat-containing domain protein [Camillea tinctor]
MADPHEPRRLLKTVHVGKLPVQADVVAIRLHDTDPGEIAWWEQEFPNIFPNYRISLYTFDIWSQTLGMYTAEQLQQESVFLLSALNELRKDNYKCPVIFVAQDIAGILLKKSLLMCSKHPELYRNICSYTKAMVFICTPHGTRSSKKLESALAQLVIAKKQIPEVEAWKGLRGLRDWVIGTNDAFLKTKMTVSALTLSAMSTNVDANPKDFEDYNCSMSTPLELLWTSGAPFDQVVRTIPWKELNLEGLLQNFESGILAYELRKLLSLAIPQCLSKELTTSKGQKAVTDLDSFEQWNQSEGFRILLIQSHGNFGSVIGDIFANLAKPTAGSFSRRRLLYFMLDTTDSRTSSVESMLLTLLCQLVYHCQHLGEEKTINAARECFQALPPHQFLKTEDLYILFIDILLEVQASRTQPPVAIVIGGLDKVPKSGSWFLEKLQSISQDCELDIKVIVICSDPHSLLKDNSNILILQAGGGQVGCDSICKGRHSQPQTEEESRPKTQPNESFHVNDTTHILDDECIALIHDRPQLYNHRKVLAKLRQSCLPDRKLSQLTLSWLKVADLPLVENAIKTYLSTLLPASLRNISGQILSSITSSDHLWASSILEVLLHSFRPLTVWELALIDSSNQNKMVSVFNLSQKLEYVFKGLITICHGHVHLAHPGLRDLLITEYSTDMDLHIIIKGEEEVHQRLASSCIAYLLSLTPEELASAELSSLQSREDLLYYATTQWPLHARRANLDELKSRILFQDFLQNDGKIISLWAMIYISLDPLTLPSPLHSAYTDPNSALPILAKYGLQYLFSIVREAFQDIPSSKTEQSRAISVASIVGDVELTTSVCGIIPRDAAVDVPMLVAIENGETEVLISSDAKADNEEAHMKCFQVLCRTASLDKADIVKHILDTETYNMDIWASDTNAVSRPPIYYVAQRNCIRTAKILLSNELCTHPILRSLLEWENKEIIWRSVCKLGSTDILGILLDSKRIGVNISNEAQAHYHRIAIDTAIKHGRFKILELLLQWNFRFNKKDMIEGDKVSLQLAIRSKRGKCSSRLIENLGSHIGSDVALVTEAIKAQSTNICEKLLQHISRPVLDINISSYLSDAIETRNLTMIQMIYNHAEERGMENTSSMTEALEHVVRQLLRMEDDFDEDIISWVYSKAVYRNNLRNFRVYNRTPLFYAAYRGFSWLCRALVKANVDVNEIGDSDEWYPVHGAYDNAIITRILVEAGADINKRTRSGATALELALKRNHSEVVEVLLKAGPSQETLRNGFQKALWERKYGMANRILRANIELCYPMPNVDRYLLHKLVLIGNTELVESILKYEVDLELTRGRGVTALQCIKRETDVSITRMLINRGANLEGSKNSSITPLLMAVLAGNLSVAKLLVSKGAKVDIDDPCWNPLHQACCSASIDMVKFLHQEGADVNKPLQSSKGTPLQTACLRKSSREKDEIINFFLQDNNVNLEQKSARWGSNVVGLACLTCETTIVGKMIDRQANITAEDHLKRTAIHFALYRTPDYVQLLLDHGGSLDSVDIMGRHALHYAAASGQLETIKFVLKERKDLINGEDCHK